MPVIAIAGMLGAGCTEVAQNLLKISGIDFVNSERIIRKIVAEEKLTFAELARLASSGEVNLDDIIKSELLDLINEGNVVIEGRIAFLVLDVENVDIKVFLWAPVEYRAKRVAERRRISFEEALEHVRGSDEDRSSLVKRLYKKDWLDADLYDAVLNTSKWSLSEVAKLIYEMAKMRTK